MRYQTFGRRTGLRVSELALGTANFGTGPSARSGPEEARSILDAFADAGGNFVDTADAYQSGEAESVLGELLAGRRERFVLGTKYSRMPRPGVNLTGNSRRSAIRSVEASLKRLRTDYLDVLWVHLPDGVTPIDEIVETFEDLVRAGKILHGGLSNFPAWRVAAAALKSTAMIAVQEPMSLVTRGVEREVLPAAEAFGLGMCVFWPLGGGLLTGKYRHGADGRLTAWGAGVQVEDSAQRKSIVDTLLDVAEELGVVPAQAAMAWLLARTARTATAVVPIIGPRTVAQLDDYLGALTVRLSEEQYARLDSVSALDLAPEDASPAFGGEADRFRRPVVPVV
jgi:aryl-alcohol dehydrogenase-like predicted oxidoreductase